MTTETILAVILAVFGSTGFWTVINRLIDRHEKKKNSPEIQLLLGLAHDRICFLCECYIKRGYTTRDEYENLNDYLFVPYEKCGGNGTAAKFMAEYKKLPIRKEIAS